MKDPLSLSQFGAVAIATALGISPRALRKRLEDVPPSGWTLTRGQQSHAWTIERLPVVMREELTARAARQGYRSTGHLLADPVNGWQPVIQGEKVTIGQVAESCVAEAVKLQRALLPSLNRLTAVPPPPPADAESLGLAEYKAEFGHAVSARHWRRLVDRTIERAGSRAEFPLEIFLPAQLTRRGAAGEPVCTALSIGLQDLCRAISHVKKPVAPTPEEEAFLWDVAFSEMATLVQAGSEQRKARRTVFQALANSGVRLAKSAPALEMAFSRKLARWEAGGCKPSVLMDRRTGEREGSKIELPEKDRHIIIARSVEAGGRVSQGFRTAFEAGELSPETAQRTIATPASKSYVPRRIRNTVRHDVANLADLHHGPRQAKLNGAWIQRDYSDIAPGDVFQLDDCTAPLYFADETPEGTVAMRGQLLLMIDVKTSFILGFALHSERNYNAAIIRRLILRVHDEWGLPRKGLYLEKGIWKSSRLLKGRPADEITLQETEMGLREYVRFRHAELPRAKVVENILGKLQNLIEPELGYVGRMEQVEKFERIQKRLLQASRGKIPHASFLYSKEQWTAKLEAYCKQYNADRQHGRLRGRSPAEAYEGEFDYQNPVVRLDGCSQYLLANHRRKEKVTKNGIRIIWRGEPFYYRSEDTSRLRGQEVLLWFDVEGCPQSVTLTDLQHRNPVEVPRANPVPSWTATPQELKAAQAQAAAHGEHQKTLYRIIVPHLKETMFRKTYADLNTAMVGQAIETGRAKARAGQEEQKHLARRIAAKEQEIGGRIAPKHRNPETKLEGLERMQRFLNAAKAEETQL